MRKENRLESLLNDKQNLDLVLSYSKISDFDRNGPKTLLERTFLKNQGVKMGSLIDDMLFSRDDFKSKYLISSFSEPSSTLGTLCKIILENYTSIPPIEEIFNIIENSGLWKSTKKKELLEENFNHKEFWGYLNEQFDAQNKTIVTMQEKMVADEIVSILINHEHSKHLFNDSMEHIYQYKFEYEFNEVSLRGIIDILSIDHKNKKIYFKDLKTGSGIIDEFEASYIKYRYYLQEAVYSLAFESICKNLGLEDYTLQPFEFIYISLKEKIPINFIVTGKWHEAALKGFKTASGYLYKGLYKLLDEIKFHWTRKIFDLSKDIYENSGRVNLKDNFIEVL